jgi:hypothetical protein
MKYRYYIVCLMQGAVLGTNDAAVAENYSLSDDAFVIDTDYDSIGHCVWLTSDGATEIPEAGAQCYKPLDGLDSEEEDQS